MDLNTDSKFGRSDPHLWLAALLMYIPTGQTNLYLEEPAAMEIVSQESKLYTSEPNLELYRKGIKNVALFLQEIFFGLPERSNKGATYLTVTSDISKFVEQI